MMPHAHVRGKAFEYKITPPNGATETILSVPHYDFHWQLTYYPAKPIHLPKGTKLEVTAWYDNSANNPIQSGSRPRSCIGASRPWEEMMIGYYSVVETDPQKPAQTSGGGR